jgi:tellurite resistance protein TerC
MRKAAVLVLGGTVLLIGVALIVLPGPAFVVIPTGLAILATEFLWARRLLDKAKEKVAHAAQRVKRAAPTDRA